MAVLQQLERLQAERGGDGLPAQEWPRDMPSHPAEEGREDTLPVGDQGEERAHLGQDGDEHSPFKDEPPIGRWQPAADDYVNEKEGDEAGAMSPVPPQATPPQGSQPIPDAPPRQRTRGAAEGQPLIVDRATWFRQQAEGAAGTPPPPFTMPGLAAHADSIRLLSDRAYQSSKRAGVGRSSPADARSLGQQPAAPQEPPEAAPPARPPQPPAAPGQQTPAADGGKATTPHEVEASEADTKVLNGVYHLSPTARLVYNEAHKLGYRTQFVKPGTVAQMNGSRNAIATVRGGVVKLIYVDTISPEGRPPLTHGTAVFHEAFHIIQEQYLRDPSKLTAEARRLVENVRYQEDYNVGISPNDLEARRVQNIILQETSKRSGVTYPLLREYDGHFLPPGTERGRGGERWQPGEDVPSDTPPASVKPKPKPD